MDGQQLVTFVLLLTLVTAFGWILCYSLPRAVATMVESRQESILRDFHSFRASKPRLRKDEALEGMERHMRFSLAYSGVMTAGDTVVFLGRVRRLAKHSSHERGGHEAPVYRALTHRQQLRAANMLARFMKYGFLKNLLKSPVWFLLLPVLWWTNRLLPTPAVQEDDELVAEVFSSAALLASQANPLLAPSAGGRHRTPMPV